MANPPVALDDAPRVRRVRPRSACAG
jgi:hypothetical protein